VKAPTSNLHTNWTTQTRISGPGLITWNLWTWYKRIW